MTGVGGTPVGVVPIGVTGQALPGGGSLAAILQAPAPAINAAGRVAFPAWVDEPFVDGIFVGDGTGPLVKIVRGRDATPSGNGVFSDFFGLLSNHPFNDRGEVAFVGVLDDTAGGTADNQGLFLGDGSTLVELVRRGESTPDGNGSFLNFGGLIDLDDAGRVIFRTTVTGASGGATDGLFIADRNGVEQILRRNDPAPGGGLFADVLESSLSAAGVVFRAYVNLDNGGSTNDELGAFFYNRTGLRSIAREGDTLAGFGTVTDVHLHAASETEGIEGTADGDGGQVALRFTSGGEFLTAVWSGATLLKDGFESGDTSAWSAR
ncbi:MAG: hypothetical protein GY719_02610 [bacterium]|nr:hypothetical protein [bacterium]